MEDLAHTHNFVCTDAAPCRSYSSGHHIHWIHWNQVAKTPELFRDAVVSCAEGHRVDVEFVDGGTATFFNHEDLGVLLSRGDAVRVHSRFHVLLARTCRLNLTTSADLRPRPVGDLEL